VRLNRPDGTGSPVQAGMYLKHNLNSAGAVPGGGATGLIGPGRAATFSSGVRQIATALAIIVITNVILPGTRISVLPSRLRNRRNPQPKLFAVTWDRLAEKDRFSVRRKIHRQRPPREGACGARSAFVRGLAARSDLTAGGMAPRRRRQAREHPSAWIRTRKEGEIQV